MPVLPLTVISGLVWNGDSATKGNYRLERGDGAARLYHYGTLIATVSETCEFHGFSASDRDAANSLFDLMGRSTRVRLDHGHATYYEAD